VAVGPRGSAVTISHHEHEHQHQHNQHQHKHKHQHQHDHVPAKVRKPNAVLSDEIKA
jgi:hypothetical protein